MIFGITSGQRVTKKAVVGASVVTLHTSSRKMSLTLESIAICNTDASSRTISVYIEKGASQFYLFSGKAIASKETFVLSDHPLNLTDGESLKAEASGAGVHVTASIVQSTPVQLEQPQTALGSGMQRPKVYA